MTSLIIGIVLIVAGVAFAAAPLLRRRTNPDAALGGKGDALAGEAPAKPERVASSGPGAVVADPSTVLALEELEMDRAMGKLAPEDYTRLRAQLQHRASGSSASLPAASLPAASLPAASLPAASLPAASLPIGRAPAEAANADGPGAPAPVPVADETSALVQRAEQLIESVRGAAVSCADCGPRPEPSARHCSNCGRALGACPSCAHPIAQAGARFCDRCGAPLGR